MWNIDLPPFTNFYKDWIKQLFQSEKCVVLEGEYVEKEVLENQISDPQHIPVMIRIRTPRPPLIFCNFSYLNIIICSIIELNETEELYFRLRRRRSRITWIDNMKK